MKRTFGLLLCALILTCAYDADATVVNFDDLSGNNLPLPANYGGISWGPNWKYYSSVDSPYTAHSTPTRISYGSYFDFPDPVIFQGAWFSGYSFDMLYFDLYLGGVYKGSSATLAPSATPAFLAADFRIVDRVYLRYTSNGHHAMDDVTFSAVPEPASLSLLGLGLAGLLRFRKRKV